MGYGAVQFRGLENVMQAYDARQIDAWSVWCSKQFLNKGWGGNDLQTFLDALLKGGTNAIYTLKVYEDIKREEDVAKIKANTPDDGSFNFRLNGDDMLPAPGAIAGYQSRTNNYAELDARMKRIEELLLQQAEGPGQDDEAETIGSVLIDILKDPGKVSKYVDVITAVFKPNQTPPMPAQVVPMPQAAKVGNHESKQPPTEEALNRLATAIDTPEKHDPKLIDHLEKLATMASSNPGQFNMLISLLEKF